MKRLGQYLSQNLSQNLSQWIGLVVEVPCPLCQRSTAQEFCLDCQRQILGCRVESPGWMEAEGLAVLGWGRYNGALKRAIAAFKYHHHSELARSLGQWMGQSWSAANPAKGKFIVVPIPMHAAKQQERGFNQAELLARHFCDTTGLSLAVHGLERIRATEAQFRLSPLARAANLQEAFQVGSAFLQKKPAHPVLLLDDIYTTGATARSAAQTLRRQGIRVQGMVVLARASLENRL